MFRNIVISAFGAGLAVCVVITALQFATTEPLILHAEEFEGGAPHDHAATAAPHDHQTDVAVATQGDAVAAHEAAAPEEWAPADGFERVFFTVIANLLVGVSVSLILIGVMTLKGGPIDVRSGLLWGAAGFVAVSLLPSLGLPPELPGTPAADIVDRQTWWLATAAASGIGIALIAFGGHWAWKVAGLALIVAPHVIGAPAPPSYDVTYPGALAGEFVIASLVVSAVLWSFSGAAVGWFYQRMSSAA